MSSSVIDYTAFSAATPSFLKFCIKQETNQLCDLVSKRMFVFLQSYLASLIEKADMLHPEYFSQQRIDQLNMDKHLVIGSADTYKGRVHQVTEFEVDLFY